MANLTWEGTSTPGDLSVAANWSPSQVPTTGDVLRFLTGNQPVTSGLTQTSKSFGGIITGRNYSGAIGSPTGYLICGATKVTHEGKGAMFLDNTASSLDFDDVILNSGTSPERLFLKGTVGEVQAKSGKLTYEGGTLSDLWMEKVAQAQLDVILTGGTITRGKQMGGMLALDASGSGVITTLDILASTCHVQGGTVTNLNMWGGICNWWTTNTCAAAKMYGGTLDGATDERAKTFTLVETHAGCVVRLVNAPANIVVTTWHRIGGDVEIIGTAAAQVV